MTVSSRREVLAFLRTIKENPNDDVPRLILGDWLQEHGASEAERARGEFIHLQCRLDPMATADRERKRRRLAPTRAADPEHVALFNRQQALRQRHEADWLGPLLGAPIHSWDFRRGLLHVCVEKANIRSKDFIALLGMEALAWVESVRLQRITSDALIRCLASPALEEVVALEIPDTTISVAEGRALANCRHLANLTSLSLEGTRLRPGVLQELAASGYLRGIISLNLSGNRGVNQDVFFDLAALTSWSRLAELDLSSCGGGVWNCWKPLPESPLLAQITRLNLGSNFDIDSLCSQHLGGRYGGRLYEGCFIEELATSPHVAQLTHLDLTWNDVRPACAQTLVESPFLNKLLHLHLEGNPITRGSEVEVALRRRFGCVVSL